MIRDLVSYPCQDACAERVTGRTVDGAPVYVCPGCDSEWYDDRECTKPAPPAAPDPSRDRRLGELGSGPDGDVGEVHIR